MLHRFVVFGILLAVFDGSEGRSKSPLLDEDVIRAKNKAAECIFGKQVRELGSQWIPDLGPPIGVLYCIKCECIPFQKKRRIVARVQCRNIKNECPETTCDEPVQLPGRCCKTCPGDEMQPSDVLQDVVPQYVIDDEDKKSKHYAALLTGKSSLVLKNDELKLVPDDQNKNNVVATGRFFFQKKNLYYSFYISDKAARPRSLQFVDKDNGTILEDFVLSGAGGYVNSVYQNATRKVCGVWRRLPRTYRRLLKDQKMYAVLVWGTKDQAEFTLSGQLKKYNDSVLLTELFTSLLEPAPGTNSLMMAGAGGTAMVSISTAYSPLIHISVVFNGIFAREDLYDVPIDITLSWDEKKQTILQERVTVRKPDYDLNLINISMPVSPSDLRLLTRARLVLSVSSVSNPDALRLSGSVVAKATCEIFQSALSSTSSDRNANQQGVLGLSWLYLNNEGSLIYNVQVDGIDDEKKPVIITLVDTSNKRRTELEDLTPSFHQGWANGTLNRLGPKMVESLYSGNLMVNVATTTDSSLISGKLASKFVAEARDAPAPILLKREDYNLPASAVGVAWINIDNDCHLHYDVSLSGFGNTERQLWLSMELLPKIAPGAPVITKNLEEFQTGRDIQVEGSPTEALSKEELTLLDSGVVFIKVRDRRTKNTLLAATLKQVVVPQSCLSSVEGSVDQPLDDNEVPQASVCFHEEKYYQEEAQWISSEDPCTMCFCQNGKYKCDTMVCPEVDCPKSQQVKHTEQCCSVCSNSTIQENNTSIPKGCNFASQFYFAGSRFHPFLIPNGFDRCTVCVCDPLLLEVKCSRLSNDKMCGKSALLTHDPSYVQDQRHMVTLKPLMPRRKPGEPSPEKILKDGGCPNNSNPKNPYPNGTKYHPYISSLGEYKCITCTCTNGHSECEKIPCTSHNLCETELDLRTKKRCRKFRQRKRKNRNG